MAFTAGKASSSSSSTSTPRSWTYHVFLSFSGDTRKGFTDHLYASLQRKGITTFKDDKDLERGEEISHELMKAIEESMFAITVLSPNYAFSTWCLDELQKIIECNKNQGLVVVPVFYGVDPSHVRHQRGSVAEAFIKHEKRFGQDREKLERSRDALRQVASYSGLDSNNHNLEFIPSDVSCKKRSFAEAFQKHEENFQQDRAQKLERWRDALRQVASYSGWDSKNQFEAALVESIAEDIHKKLIPKLPSCAENLVGIASRVEEVYSLIGMGLNDVRFIGIWGMGGIGKTTIVRSVYESIQGGFEVSCFLANIREVCETNGLIYKQKELVSHGNISRSDFYNLYDGKKTIQNFLCNKKVLLVLDDVSEASQLENLAGKQDWFGPGSRVIITTRDMHLLRIHEVHKTYEVGCLVQNEGLHLFSLKAFKRDQPEEGFLDLSKKVVEYARGLPLALEILGSYLYGRTVDVWHCALKQIRSVAQAKILDTLKISYEALDPLEKNMFLDIACFFKGMKIDEVMDILENCGHCPEIGIEVLIERSLVYLERWSNNLEMHDLLQEMGRNIVFQESPNDPGRRSRLWSQEDINHVLTKNKGTKAIQGIVLNLLEPNEAHWGTNVFCKTCQIKFLSLCDMQLPHGLNCLPSALKVLHWNGCPFETLPLTNQQDEVVDIKLSRSKIELLWYGTKFLEKLKYLDLSFSKNLKRSPDLFGVPNLERFVLEGCTSLIEVHPSLVCHKKLVLLNLKDCKSLKVFPSKLEMSSLKKLILSGCSEFKILPHIGKSMEALSMLSLEGTAIRKLPLSLGCLVGLTVLNLQDCKYLHCLPFTIQELKFLKILNISGCSKLYRLPESLKEMKCLEELYASGTAFGELPLSIFYLDNLSVLSFDQCKGSVSKSFNLFLLFLSLFKSQPYPIGFMLPHPVWSLRSFTSINLSYCNLSEESIPDDFCHLSSLMALDLTGNYFVSLPGSVSKLPKLKNLSLNECRKLQLLSELPSSLTQLDASNCCSLKTFKFNPSKPCSLLASPIGQWPSCDPLYYYSVFEVSPALLSKINYYDLLPSTRFDMLITERGTPTWFGPGKRVSTKKIQISANFPLNEWVGFALCFRLPVYPCPRLVCHHDEIKCYLLRPYGRMLINTRTLPPMAKYYSHLYILYLSVDRFRDRIYKDFYWNEIEFELKCPSCDSLKIEVCGCRVIRKQDIEVFREQQLNSTSVANFWS